jgi:hypothetical protein
MLCVEPASCVLKLLCVYLYVYGNVQPCVLGYRVYETKRKRQPTGFSQMIPPSLRRRTVFSLILSSVSNEGTAKGFGTGYRFYSL